MFRSCGDAASRHASRSASGIAGLDLELRERRPRADRAVLHAARHDAAHVDEPLRLEQPVPQQRHDLRPAVDEEHRRRARRR